MDTLLQKLQAFFKDKPDVVFAYLYGSHAKGTANRLSDFDLAVFLNDEIVAKEKRFKRRLELMCEAMSLLKTDEVDLVILNDAPPLLAHEALKHGVILVDNNAHIKSEFFIRTMQRYEDWKRLKAPFFEAMIKSIKEGRFGKVS